MKKLIINNGKALADSTGKVLAIESDVTITSKGGWQGTAVPTSGMVGNIYVNNSLSVDEVILIFESLNFVDDVSNEGQKLWASLSDSTMSKVLAVYYWIDEDVYRIYALDDSSNPPVIFTTSSIDTNCPYGWNPEFDGVLVYNMDNELTVVAPSVGFKPENEKASMLFSTTPFVQSSGESIGLSGEYDGSPIEVSESVDMKALIDEKKIPLLINVKGGNSVIEVEEFPTENVQDLTFYKKTSKTNTVFYMVFDGSPINIADTGGNVHVVDELPTNMEVTDVTSQTIHIYILNGIGYVYADLGNGLTTCTMAEFYATMGLTLENKGAVESVAEMTTDGFYVIYGKESVQIGVKNETYNFVDGVWNNYNEMLLGLMEGTITDLTLQTTKVKDYACRLCTSLRSIYLPKCKSIGIRAFDECIVLTTARLPICETIKGSAFQDTSLTDIYLGYDGVVTLGSDVFLKETKTNVHVRAELLSDYQADTNWTEAVTKGNVILVGDYTD